MNVSVEPMVHGTISSVLKVFGIDIDELDLLDYFQSLGEVFVGRIDDKIVCCWGLVPPSFLSNQAYLWMWNPEPIKHQLVFIRRSQIEVQKMLERYDEIIGECRVGAGSARRWLQWLGAEFGQPSGGLIPFTIRKSNG